MLVKRKLKKRAELWTRLKALENFYFGCPDSRTWEKHRAEYLQVYKEIQDLRRNLLTVFL